MDSTKIIGLVGGVASGKSLVAKMLVQLGAGLLDADRTGHAVLAEDAEVHQAIRKRWGDEVFKVDGSVDRAAVARRVFARDNSGEVDRKWLEGLIHPRIRDRLLEQRVKFAAQNKPAVVLDAPVLLEAGWGHLCDVILMVDVARETRLARARQRGWTEAEFDRREAAQWSVDDKRRVTNFVVRNDGTEEDLRRSVNRFWQQAVVGHPSDA